MNKENEFGIKTDEELRLESETAEELKLKINNIVWMHAGENTTLRKAEEIACRFFNDIWKSRTGSTLD